MHSHQSAEAGGRDDASMNTQVARVAPLDALAPAPLPIRFLSRSAVARLFGVSASTVAAGWSGYFLNLLNQLGIAYPPGWANAPIAGTGITDLHLTGAVRAT